MSGVFAWFLLLDVGVGSWGWESVWVFFEGSSTKTRRHLLYLTSISNNRRWLIHMGNVLGKVWCFILYERWLWMMAKMKAWNVIVLGIKLLLGALCFLTRWHLFWYVASKRKALSIYCQSRRIMDLMFISKHSGWQVVYSSIDLWDWVYHVLDLFVSKCGMVLEWLVKVNHFLLGIYHFLIVTFGLSLFFRNSITDHNFFELVLH